MNELRRVPRSPEYSRTTQLVGLLHKGESTDQMRQLTKLTLQSTS